MRILVINPNSNASVTAGLRDAVADRARPGEVDIDCITLPEAPFGIETDADIAAVRPMIVDRIVTSQETCDAFVIACYSDPGLDQSQAVCARPIRGIHESALTLAASRGRPFGVLALSQGSIARHLSYIRRTGHQKHHVGERPLNLSVDAAANDPGALARIVAVGRELRDENGAETLILGCAGMARHRAAAEETLGIPVIDPVQAAVDLLIPAPSGLRHHGASGAA